MPTAPRTWHFSAPARRHRPLTGRPPDGSATPGPAPMSPSPAMPRDLTPLFAPSSVAVLGASNDPAKWGNWLARGALRGAAPAAGLPGQPQRHARCSGSPTYRSVEELPGTPELVVVAVPACGLRRGGRRLAGEGRSGVRRHHGRARRVGPRGPAARGGAGQRAYAPPARSCWARTASVSTTHPPISASARTSFRRARSA